MISDLLGSPKKGDLMGETGLSYQPSMNIHDPSKLQSWEDSPRKYFFQHILGWRRDEPNIHLGFGSAWHDAMEHLSLSLNTDDPYSNRIVMEAYELFMDCFRSEFPNEVMHFDNSAKNPGNALQALAEYAEVWREDAQKFKTLYTETAFSVPISDTRVIHGKMDTILLRHEQFIESLEHKTTGRKTQSWIDQWDVILQPMIYTYALKAIFEETAVRGVTINGAILRSKSNEFIRIPVAKSDNMLRAGLWKVNHYLDQIEWSMENLLETSPDDDVLAAFPCAGQSCSKFGCEFSAFCAHWANPLQHAHTPPPGFTQEFWDPRRQEETAKNVVHVSESKDIKPVKRAEKEAE